jgi:hypothetical protein
LSGFVVAGCNGSKVFQMIRVVTFVADQSFAWCCRREQRCGALDVGDVSARQQEGVGAAVFVDERVDFCRAPAA